MLYLDSNDIRTVGLDWDDSIDRIRQAVKTLDKGDFVQPLKPYLRFGNLQNRIIAMPAYIGDTIQSCGIKWIASFPDNIKKGKARANSVVVLNDVDTGEVSCIISSTLISTIRTASVTAMVLDEFLKSKKNRKFNLGIIGWGPIGQNHYLACTHVLDSRLNNVYLYDKYKTIDYTDPIGSEDRDRIYICSSSDDVCSRSDIIITCTASKERYISSIDHDGVIALDVSLRDYDLKALKKFKKPILTDDWEEVNRENTDIEYMFLNGLLKKNETKNINEYIGCNFFDMYEENDNILFAPMGMAVFDIAIGSLYYKKALDQGIGKVLQN